MSSNIHTKYPFKIEKDELVEYLKAKREQCYELAFTTAELRVSGKHTDYSPRDYELMGNTFGIVLYKIWGVLGDE